MIAYFFFCFFLSICVEFGSQNASHFVRQVTDSEGQGGDSGPSIPLPPARIREDSTPAFAKLRYGGRRKVGQRRPIWAGLTLLLRIRQLTESKFATR